MKKNFWSSIAPVVIVSASLGLAGCTSSKTDEKTAEKNTQSTVTEEKAVSASGTVNSANIEGLPDGFPSEVPIYDGAKVIDSDNFNSNNYYVTYLVDEDYQNVADYYVNAFNLDSSMVGESESYFEGFDAGDIFIKGLTIESTGDGTNVYITLQDNSQPSGETSSYSDDEGSDNSDYTDDTSSSGMTYDSAQEVALDSGYPADVVPIYPDAKVVGCSIVPGKSSGFVDLLLPADAFNDAVSYYMLELGLEPKLGETTVMKTAEFNGEIENIKVSVLISQILSDGRDPYVQITVNEK